MVGFIFCAVFTGIFVEKFEDKAYTYSVGMSIGTAICYVFGTVWLAFQMNITFIQALLMGVVPYLLWDGLKIAVSTLLGYKFRIRLKSMDLIIE